MVKKISSGQTFTSILSLHCDLDLEHSTTIFPRTLWLMMLYYQIKFVSKRTSSLEDIAEIVLYFDYMKPHCKLDIEDSEPIFLHDTLAHDAA